MDPYLGVIVGGESGVALVPEISPAPVREEDRGAVDVGRGITSAWRVWMMEVDHLLLCVMKHDCSVPCHVHAALGHDLLRDPLI